jgi:hypothetical protein
MEGIPAGMKAVPLGMQPVPGRTEAGPAGRAAVPAGMTPAALQKPQRVQGVGDPGQRPCPPVVLEFAHCRFRFEGLDPSASLGSWSRWWLQESQGGLEWLSVPAPWL